MLRCAIAGVVKRNRSSCIVIVSDIEDQVVEAAKSPLIPQRGDETIIPGHVPRAGV